MKDREKGQISPDRAASSHSKPNQREQAKPENRSAEGKRSLSTLELTKDLVDRERRRRRANTEEFKTPEDVLRYLAKPGNWKKELKKL